MVFFGFTLAYKLGHRLDGRFKSLLIQLSGVVLIFIYKGTSLFSCTK